MRELGLARWPDGYNVLVVVQRAISMRTKTGSFPAGIAPLTLLVFFAAGAASAQAPSFPACDSSQTLSQYKVCEVVIPQSTYVDPDGDFKAYTMPDVKAVF